MNIEQARNIYAAVGEAGAAITAFAEAAQAEARGELKDEDLIAVCEDYLAAQTRLENARNTRGSL